MAFEVVSKHKIRFCLRYYEWCSVHGQVTSGEEGHANTKILIHIALILKITGSDMNLFLFLVCPEIILQCTKLHYALNQTQGLLILDQTWPCARSPAQCATRLVKPVKRKEGCQMSKELCTWKSLQCDCERWLNYRESLLTSTYRAEKKSLYKVARMLQASWGRSDKQNQEQTSPNHVQGLSLSSVCEPAAVRVARC